MSSSSRLSASTAAVVGLAFIVLLTSGCANMPQRRWDGCAIGGGVAGLILGGTAGGVMGTEFQGHHVNSTDRALYAGAGALAGAAIGALAGHYICDPVVEAAPPPPPPPPPVAAPAPPPPPPAKKIVLRGVHFDFNKAKIRPDAEPILDEAADILKQNPNVTVEVNGYCDSIGTVAYNLKLSQRRSAAVVNYLEGKGIPGDRLEPHGYGKTDFVASNKTAEGRAQNRRVELVPKQ